MLDCELSVTSPSSPRRPGVHGQVSLYPSMPKLVYGLNSQNVP